MVVTVHGAQLYFDAPVLIVTEVPTVIWARSAAETVAVTVLPLLEKEVMEIFTAGTVVPATALVAVVVAALVMDVIIIEPVPSIASVIRVFELSNVFAVAYNWAVHVPLGQ
jgi:hypothetical protein